MCSEYHEDALDDGIVGFSVGLAERPRVYADTATRTDILEEIEFEAFARAADADAIRVNLAFDEFEVALLGQNFFVELFLDRLDLVDDFLWEDGQLVKLFLVRCPVICVSHNKTPW
jgi:hypothetical protein